MIRNKTILMILTFFIGFNIVCGRGHIDVLGEKYRNGRVTNDPRFFLHYIKRAFTLYRQKHNKYPDKWSSIGRPLLLKSIAYIYLDFKEGLKLNDSNVLTIYNSYDTKEEEYKYVIDRADENYFLIHSENNVGLQNWAADVTDIWWYFKDKNEEKEMIIRLEEIVKKEKYLFLFSNTKRRRKAFSDLSGIYNPKSINILLSYLKEFDNKYLDLKTRISVSLVKNVPHLFRFESYIPVIEKIIIKESNYLRKTNNSRIKFEIKFLINNLSDLIKKIKKVRILISIKNIWPGKVCNTEYEVIDSKSLKSIPMQPWLAYPLTSLK